MNCEFLKYIWRLLKRISLRKKNVRICQSVRFNQHSVFSGNNRIGERSIVLNSKIGKCSYVDADCFLCNVEIGAFTSIAHNVRVEPWTHPSRGYISTSPSFYSLQSANGRTYTTEKSFKDELTVDGRFCKIGNDVWLCANVTIIGGVTIGDGAIVATGAVVNRDVPPYAVVGGIPAKVIRYRYSEEEIKKLLHFKWWKKSDKWLENNAKCFSDEKRFFNLIEL